MSWKKVGDGWILLVEGEISDQESTLLAEDDYVKVYVESHKKMVSYKVQIDQRRVYQVLEDEKWVVLFFGKCPDMRSKVAGVKLWRDKCIVVERFGDTPRMYCIVSR
jgi:hypothetical protein